MYPTLCHWHGYFMVSNSKRYCAILVVYLRSMMPIAIVLIYRALSGMLWRKVKAAIQSVGVIGVH